MTPAFRPNSILNHRLALYTLAGGSLVALCPTVSATPVRYDTVYDLSIPVSDTESGLRQGLDLNGDETNEFEIYLHNHWASMGDAYSAEISALAAGSAVAWDGSQFPQPFAAGESIGPAYDSWSDAPAVLVKVDSGFEAGNWPRDINETRYEGVRFQIGGQTHYGWIAASGNISDTVALRVSGWGYETTPDTAIAAGAGQLMTPEPSSLALFALGAAGIAALLRRRRQA